MEFFPLRYAGEGDFGADIVCLYWRLYAEGDGVPAIAPVQTVQRPGK